MTTQISSAVNICVRLITMVLLIFVVTAIDVIDCFYGGGLALQRTSTGLFQSQPKYDGGPGGGKSSRSGL